MFLCIPTAQLFGPEVDVWNRTSV